MERSSSCCVRLMRSCGGISKARISSNPRRPVFPSGENILSMQNSARCVLPLESISRLRNNRSTSHGGTSLPLGPSWRNASSSSYSESLRASSTRGACEVGPMNRPLNRYDNDGWLCQYASRLRSRSGRRRNGESAGVAPPSTKWLPPPVPVWRPSSMNFSVVSRLCRAASYRCVVRSTSSSQFDDGWMLTSMTPGSGVTRKLLRRGSRGGS